MTDQRSQQPEVFGATSLPVTDGPAAGPINVPLSGQGADAEFLPRVSAGYLTWITVASAGSALATLVPLSYALSVRIAAAAPGHEEILGYITGIAQLVFLVLSPLIGLWSDRLRSPLGRRTPFLYGGAVVGLLGLLIIAFAPNLVVVGGGWGLGLLGGQSANQALLAIAAERIPDEQRGKGSALNGLVSQLAPIVGIGLVYPFASSPSLIFIIPGVVGLVMVLAFPIIKREGSSMGFVPIGVVTIRSLLESYVFNPRKYPDFGWNWLGRFIFFMGLYFNTAYGTFFYAQRLDVAVKDVAGVVSLIGLMGVVAASIGAMVGGFLSDKLRRRKLFTLLGAILFVAGGVTEAFAHSMPA